MQSECLAQIGAKQPETAHGGPSADLQTDRLDPLTSTDDLEKLAPLAQWKQIFGPIQRLRRNPHRRHPARNITPPPQKTRQKGSPSRHVSGEFSPFEAPFSENVMKSQDEKVENSKKHGLFQTQSVSGRTPPQA